ncbi:alpha/beta hydrolase [Nocardioides sp. NPDC057577]|uniref:alpha/beta hydrolase n=1 Tax=Nocardioides sp. NPDC057577 TaxID=3346171 RepID=UPI003672BCBA
MPIHPEVAKVLATLPAPSAVLDPVAMRAGEASHVPPLGDRLPIASVEDMSAGDVPVRIYADSTDASGVIVYFHGGAFFLGSLDTHDHVARHLARATGLKVVSVDYRLAPENEFPAGLHDCYAAVRWVQENGEKLGWDGSTLAVAGDSSGGTFAAVVAAMATDDGYDAVTHQILFYPSLDLDFDETRYPSLVENATGYGLETAGLKPFNAFYLDSGADPDNPLVSPIKRTSFEGLPKALVVTAEFDPLRDEGERYAQRLREAGIEVNAVRWEGANHGFVQNFSQIPEFAQVFETITEFLREG